MDNLQPIRSKQQSKYNEIIEYLNQNNGYWLKNDKWDLYNNFTYNLNQARGKKFLDFSMFNNKNIRLEVKYYYIYSLKKGLLKPIYIISKAQAVIKKLAKYINNKKYISIIGLQDDNLNLFLLNEKLALNTILMYLPQMNEIINFIISFFDDRDEIEKDIWYSKNIKGAIIRASGANNSKNVSVNFKNIPKYYRDTVKRYMSSIITKRSWSHCCEILIVLIYFFNKFYENGYVDSFLTELSRQDIENYIYWLNNDYKDNNYRYRNTFLSYAMIFLEYIQLAQYNEAPKKILPFLNIKNNMIKTQVIEAKFVSDPILNQLDNNIMYLDRQQYIPIYILLRETGWRGIDILNLRYNNCLEQVWNNKNKTYNYYLCEEITKTETSQLKIPVRDKIAKMIKEIIDKANELSTEINNPKKYLFNTYQGKLKGKPLNKSSLLDTIKRLIEEKDIRDTNGDLYHFRPYSLRHTRANE